MRRGAFRSNLDTRLAVLAILGMANAVASWYRSEEAAIDRVSAEFVRLIADGVGEAAEAALARKADASVRTLTPPDAARFHRYIRRRLRLTTARSLAGTPSIAMRSKAIACGITRASIAAPFGLTRTITSRLLVAERVRVRALSSPGG